MVAKPILPFCVRHLAGSADAALLFVQCLPRTDSPKVSTGDDFLASLCQEKSGTTRHSDIALTTAAGSASGHVSVACAVLPCDNCFRSLCVRRHAMPLSSGDAWRIEGRWTWSIDGHSRRDQLLKRSMQLFRRSRSLPKP